MKNIFLKKVVTLARSFIPKNKTSDRILIVATTALGDTLWATPTIENVRKSFPQSHIAVLTSPIGLQILKNNPHIDKTFLLQEPLSTHFFSLWKTLYAEKFDTILLLHASQRLTLPLCALLGATRIIGTAGINKGLDALLTDPTPNCAQHEIVRRFTIAEKIGTTISTETLSFYLDKKEILPKRSPGPWIAIHPGSKDPFKRWPKQNFIALGKRLKQTLPCEILITGTKDERALMEEVCQAIPGAHIDREDRPLREFGALLHQMDLLISNDTGPLHLACALNTPVLGIYAATNPAICGPHKAPKAHVISQKACCDPCIKRKCKEPFCFLQINPEEVFQSAMRQLDEKIRTCH